MKNQGPIEGKQTMHQLLHATVIGAKRYTIDGQQSATLFVQQEIDGGNTDAVGLEVMKVSAPFNVVDILKKHQVPGEFEIEAVFKSLAGGRMGITAKAIKPLSSTAKQPTQAQK